MFYYHIISHHQRFNYCFPFKIRLRVVDCFEEDANKEREPTRDETDDERVWDDSRLDDVSDASSRFTDEPREARLTDLDFGGDFGRVSVPAFGRDETDRRDGPASEVASRRDKVVDVVVSSTEWGREKTEGAETCVSDAAFWSDELVVGDDRAVCCAVACSCKFEKH